MEIFLYYTFATAQIKILLRQKCSQFKEDAMRAKCYSDIMFVSGWYWIQKRDGIVIPLTRIIRQLREALENRKVVAPLETWHARFTTLPYCLL